MWISEIFYSLQGEGELTGVPSVFVRVAGCNLRCTWCDTKYASWNPEGHELAISEILAEINRHPARHVVLTGGEPMIARELPELAAQLHAEGKHITIETAGTIAPGGIACDLASLSPKLAHSTPKADEISAEWIGRHESLRLQPSILRQWMESYPYQLKFVAASKEDLVEIDDLLASIGTLAPPEKVLLMPEGQTSDQIAHHTRFAVQACKERGFRFCDRLHVALFGNTRGT